MKSKRIVLLTVSLLLYVGSSAQNFDELLSKKQTDCADISQNSGLYFVKYMQENKLDSATNLLQYWEDKCGRREPVFRAKVLLALQQYAFNDSLLTDGVLNNIFNYQNRDQMIKNANYQAYDDYRSYFGFTPPNQEFDKYTKELAAQLKNQFEENTIEYLLSEFYGENADTIFSKLQTKKYQDTKLAKDYHEVVEAYVKMYEAHISWITGVWIPTGKLAALGAHPELGFQTGIKHRKMNYDMTMTFKFVNTRNPYNATRPETGLVEPTNKFFGGHLGFDIGRDIWVHNQHELQLTGGIAFEGFDVFEADENLGYKNASANSYNFNIGLGYRYYLKHNLYLGLRAKYNVVDYTLSKVIDYTGHPITIQFIVGGVDNIYRNSNLKALKYKVRSNK